VAANAALITTAPAATILAVVSFTGCGNGKGFGTP
jgi:hypothetical protein